MPPRSSPASSAADPLDELSRAVLDRRLDRHAPAPVALALSGGGDSIALLHLAAAWAAEHGRPLLALTVDHGLNPASADWTAGAGEAARALGVPWRGLAWRGEKPASGLPAAARAARHRLLADAAREAGARVLLTGHTLDDGLENELMGLGRMTDWDPSPAWPEGRGVFLCRPLLQARRAKLRSWLNARAIPWLDDPANDDPRYARARARAHLSASPVSTGEGDHPQGGGGGMAQRSPPSPSCGWSPPPVDTGGDKSGLIRLDRTCSPRALSAALLCAAGTVTPPRGDRLRSLLARLQTGEDFTATLAGARLITQGDAVLIGRDPGRKGLPTVACQPGQALVWDGRFELISEGVAVVPLAGRLAQLSKSDRAELAVLPAWVRPTLPAHLHPDARLTLARTTPLGPARLAAALGNVEHESDI